jgi:hypothetical protein
VPLRTPPKHNNAAAAATASTVATEVAEVLALAGAGAQRALSARDVAFIIQARGWRAWPSLMEAEKEVARVLAKPGGQYLHLNNAAAATTEAQDTAAVAVAVSVAAAKTSGETSTAWETSLRLFQAVVLGEGKSSLLKNLEHPGVSVSAREPRYGGGCTR